MGSGARILAAAQLRGKLELESLPVVPCVYSLHLTVRLHWDAQFSFVTLQTSLLGNMQVLPLRPSLAPSWPSLLGPFLCEGEGVLGTGRCGF